MLDIYDELDSSQNAGFVPVQYGDYADDYGLPLPTSLNLFDILAKRASTLVIATDLASDIATDWVSNPDFTSLITNPKLTIVLVMMSNFATHANTTVSDCSDVLETFNPGVNCLIVSNEAWTNSFGSIFATAFNSVPVAAGDTPFVLMFNRIDNGSGGYNYRIVDKFHMSSDNTGDLVSTASGFLDVIKFESGGSAPEWGNLGPFITRRMTDHVAGATSFTATVSPEVGASLDLGGAIKLAFSRKTIGLGTSGNLSWTPAGAAGETPFAASEVSYNGGSGQIDIGSYLSGGENALIRPSDDSLVENAGGAIDIYASPDTTIPGNSAIVSTEGTPFVGLTALTPRKIDSVPVGKPHLYVRTNVSDDGSHTGGLSNSPDIAIYHDAVPPAADIRTSLSTAANYSTTGDIYSAVSLSATRMNRMFLRSFNSGTMRTKGLRGIMYYTTPSTVTLPTSGHWLPICEADGITQHEFFTGMELATPGVGGSSVVVSNEYLWNSHLPLFDSVNNSANHYCFLAITASENDRLFDDLDVPIPDLPIIEGRVQTYSDFLDFVRRRHVAWKNFMMIEHVDKVGNSGSSGNSGDNGDQFDWDFGKKINPKWIDERHLQIPVKLPVSRKSEFVQLEVRHKLPMNWKLDLSAKADLVMRDRMALRSTKWEPSRDLMKLKGLSARKSRIPDLVAEKNRQTGVVLDLDLPEIIKGGKYPVEIVQMYKGQELGRLSLIVTFPRIREGRLIRLNRKRPLERD